MRMSSRAPTTPCNRPTPAQTETVPMLNPLDGFQHAGQIQRKPSIAIFLRDHPRRLEHLPLQLHIRLVRLVRLVLFVRVVVAEVSVLVGGVLFLSTSSPPPRRPPFSPSSRRASVARSPRSLVPVPGNTVLCACAPRNKHPPDARRPRARGPPSASAARAPSGRSIPPSQPSRSPRRAAPRARFRARGDEQFQRSDPPSLAPPPPIVPRRSSRCASDQKSHIRSNSRSTRVPPPPRPRARRTDRRDHVRAIDASVLTVARVRPVAMCRRPSPRVVVGDRPTDGPTDAPCTIRHPFLSLTDRRETSSVSRVRFINRDAASTETHRYSYSVQHTLTLRDTHPRRDTPNTPPTHPRVAHSIAAEFHACVRALVRVIAFVRSIDRSVDSRGRARASSSCRAPARLADDRDGHAARGRRGEMLESPARDASSRTRASTRAMPFRWRRARAREMIRASVGVGRGGRAGGDGGVGGSPCLRAAPEGLPNERSSLGREGSMGGATTG